MYKIDDQKLAFLDDFEGYPSYYGRYEVEVTLVSNASIKITAWSYLFENWQPRMLDLVRYEEYDSFGSHGLPYDDRLLRTSAEEAAAVAAEVKLNPN